MSEIRVENIIGETGVDAVKFTKGINVTGVTTATTFSGSGASLTNLPAANLTGSLPAISGANLTGVSAGKILQVISVTKTDVASTTSTSYVAIPGLSASITPSSSSNKVLVTLCLGGFTGSSTDAGAVSGTEVVAVTFSYAECTSPVCNNSVNLVIFLWMLLVL